MPFTFRLIFHSLRSLWLAVILAIAAWLVFVPATRAERAALGDSPVAQTSLSLAQMRIARVVVHFAPQRAAILLSEASGGEISPEFAGMILRDIAGMSDQGRTVGGAKFVTVD